MQTTALGSIASSPGSGATGKVSLADTFDSFLKLLTTQLKNQDPLSPMDSNEFTQQLVLFTGVEQSVNTNKRLDALIGLTQANQTASAVGYLDKVIEAKGDTAVLTDGQAVWQYDLGADTAGTQLLVTDSDGKLVFSTSGQQSHGTHSFVWDGRDNQGVPQPAGAYTLTVSAKDADGRPVSATTLIKGKVTGVKTVDGGLVLAIGDILIPLDDVTSVSQAPPAPPPTPPA